MVTKTDILHNYCNAGFKLIPLRSKGKIPVLKGWQNKASSSIDQIESWRREFNTDNFGLVTGDLNGIFALDIDVKDDAQGFESMKRLIRDHGHLPTTPVQKTASGGYHYLFKKPTWLDLRNSASSIAPGIDIRGYNGQIVIEPSIIQGVGKYEWLRGKSILEIPIADAPEWLLDLIVQVAKEKKVTASKTIFHDGQKIREGEGRNQALTSFAGVLRSRGIEENAMFDMMKIFNESQFDPPLEEREVMNVWKSVQNYPPGSTAKRKVAPDEDFDPMPLPEKRSSFSFPTSIFPPKIKKFIEDGAKGLHVQPDFLGGYVLATAGLAIGNTRLIETKKGWKQKPNLWMCLVAPPGSAKTPALDLSFSPVIERQKKSEMIYQEEMEKYKRDLYQYELEKKQVKDIEELSEEPILPLLTKYYCSDATIEAQMRIMKENPRGIALYLDELSGWIRGMGQYKGGKGNDKQLNMTAWTGKPLTRDRLKEGTQSIYNSFLTVMGNLPPAQLQELSGEIKDGFIERFLFIYPDRKKPVFTWDGISKDLTDMYASIIDKIFALSAPIDETGTMQNHVVRLSEEAKPLYHDWENTLYDEMYHDDFDVRLELPWSKMGIQMCRIALIMHVLRWVEGEADSEFEIDKTTLLCAMELVNYFKEHYKKVVDQLNETEEDSKMIGVIEWIKKHSKDGVIASRDLQKNRVGGCRKATEVKKLMEQLQDLGYGQCGWKKPEGGRGRPSKIFTLNSSKY